MADFVNWTWATAWASDIAAVFAPVLAVLVGVGVGVLVLRRLLGVSSSSPSQVDTSSVNSRPSIWSRVDSERR